MSRSKIALVALCLLGVGVVFPATSSAVITASSDGTTLQITGSDDPLEDLRADVVGGEWQIGAGPSPRGVVVIAGPGCTTGSSGGVRCPLSPRVDVSMGPGIDHVLISDPTGAGYDTSTLRGGPGLDGIRVQAGDARDTLFGGDGSDGLDGGPGPDIFDGGAGGRDQVIWAAGRTRGVGVRATIGGGIGDDGSADDGQVGARDTIRPNIEEMVGTTARDTLIGTRGPDFLNGVAGADALLGRQGKDQLTGGAGADTLFGGDGLDFLIAARFGSAPDRDRRLDCGPPDRRERVSRDAEDPPPVNC